MEILNNDSFNDLLIHSINVSNYAVKFGEELMLNNEQLEILRIGGLLHDIGKLLIPENILNKTTKLTYEEFEIIKKHPIIGELLLQNDFCKEVKEIIRSHHERIDGKGYPSGLRDNNIPYLVKIISICDAFDAMTTNRPYNNVKTIEEALNELYKCSIPKMDEENEIIQQFDSDLVKRFSNLMKNKEKILYKK